MLALLILTACDGCRPELPDEEEQPNDSPPPADSGDSADTGEPPDLPPELCRIVEVEDENFNDDYLDIMTLPLESYACGKIDVEEDFDWFTFTTTEPGWFSVEAQAASRGSSADLYYTLSFLDGDDAVVQTAQERSTDPRTVWLMEEAGTYQFALRESTGGFGDSYKWWVLAQTIKAPVEYDSTEAGEHSTVETAVTLRDGEVMFARIDEAGQSDWWNVDIPAGATGITVITEAYHHGSPADLAIDLYWESGNLIWADNYGEYDYDLDPFAEVSVNPEVGHTNVRLRVYVEGEKYGSDFHWYTIQAYATYETTQETP